MNWNEVKNNVTFNDIKEMEYKSIVNTPKKYEILCQSWYKGYKVLIVSYFTHPCAYIGLPLVHKYNQVYYDDIHDISCHGGLTYSGDYHLAVKELQNSGWFIGWDYMHACDQCGMSPGLGDKKWTTMEIINECMSVVEQLIKIQNTYERILEPKE